MSELILHHYPASPFAQKVRWLLGFKGLCWHSVMIPNIMPKPDLTALTGGYRKTPVLQIGADIYCDTRLIARLLDTLEPAPALVPAEHALSVQALVYWAETQVFPAAVAHAFIPQNLASRFANAPEEALKAFSADRHALFQSGTARGMSAQQATGLWPQIVELIEEQLAGKDYLVGPLTLADFALAHPLWFLVQDKMTAALVNEYPTIKAWLERVMNVGEGTPVKLRSQEAIELANSLSPLGLPLYDVLPIKGCELGQRIEVRAIDYGIEPTEGTLVYAGVHEVIIERQDPRAGLVHVHFPRAGFAFKGL